MAQQQKDDFESDDFEPDSTNLPTNKLRELPKEVTRGDSSMFTIDTTGIHNWAADIASKLPRSLQGVGGMTLDMLTAFPVDVIAGILGDPTAPVMGAAGLAKSNIAKSPAGRLNRLIEADDKAGIPKLKDLAVQQRKSAPEMLKSDIELPSRFQESKPVSYPLPEPKSGTPPYNTSQFGLTPASDDNLPYPLNIVPNRLRPPSTNATVFDALLPERYKINEQGAAVRPTTSLKDPHAIKLPEEPVKKPSIHFEDAPAPLDEVNAVPLEAPKTAEETILPGPGQAVSRSEFKDISGFTANFSSPDITLSSRPVTKPIADLIVTANDNKMRWIATTERELADLSKGLSKQDRIQLGKLLDGQEIEITNPELQARAAKARQLLDEVHAQFPEGSTKAGENVGYLENYFTHLESQPENIRSATKRIMEHHLGPFKVPDENIPSSGRIGEATARDPRSPFVETRTGALSDLEYDVNKVFPAYIESAAKVIWDKPAVNAAEKLLNDIPNGNLKELATWYVRNYSNYDSLPGLHQAWNNWTNTIARTTARSLLGFNTGLQTLHLARIPANLWPELGTKYATLGLQKVASHPIQAWQESAKLGLLQNEVRPFAFKTVGEKFDSISNFLSFADYLDKTIGYHGYKAKFVEQGMDETAASLAALRETKRLSQTSDNARRMMGFTPPAGGNAIATTAIKLGGQFKQVPAKIVEQYINIARSAKDNPKAAARLLGGVALVMGANEGARTFHIDPLHMVPSSIWGAFGDTVYKISHALAKGDVNSALKETVLWATPAGKSIERQLKYGPSALQ